MKTSISFLSSKFSILETLIKIDNTDCDYIHVDIMDGNFTEDKFSELDYLKQTILSKKLDVHLMSYNVLDWIEKFKYLNVNNIIFQAEINEDKLEIINSIKREKIKVGIAISPESDLNILTPYLNLVDIVLVLGVMPGKGGQQFIPETLERITKLRDLKKENKYHYKIEVDGGISDENVHDLKKAGCNIVVSGSFICKRNNFQEQLDLLKQKM